MNLRNLNTAESIALSRVIGFPLILLLIYFSNRSLTAWAYIILFSTDFIDGFFAYFFSQESPRRAKLDSLGDILLLLTGLAGFYYFEEDFLKEQLIPISIVLGLYLIQFLLGVLKWGRPSSFHTFSAKLAAIAQVIFLSLTLMLVPSIFLFYLAVVLSIVDAVEGIILTLLLTNWQANIKGIFWYKREKSTPEKADCP